MGTTIGRVGRVDPDEEEGNADEDVVEAFFEHSKLYPCKNINTLSGTVNSERLNHKISMLII